MRYGLKILIIGAGPTGLTLAADLARRGIQAKIVDKNDGPTKLSKALGVQAGTLMCFDATLGNKLTQKMIDAGREIYKSNIFIDEQDPISVDFSTIKPPYSFMLMLEQFKTENFLEEYLVSYGGNVLRNTEVELILQDEKSVSIKYTDGEVEEFDFVIGCDGAHSKVRKAMKAGFIGEQYEAGFSLADVDIETDLPMEVRTYIQPNGVVAFFPYKEHNHYRIIYASKGAIKRSDISFEDFQSELKEILPDAPKIKNPKWITRFNINHRLVETYRHGRLFLAGDAAHIHSPVGGQGMNMGILDALNLSSKLAKYAEGVDELDLYSQERKSVAQAIVKGTDSLTKLGIRKESWTTKIIRRNLIPFMISKQRVQKRLAHNMSQVGWAIEEVNRFYT